MKRLLLLGGGLAHLHCLERFAEHPLVDAQVALVSPGPRILYSGMVPGWIAGHYTLEQCAIALDRVAERAGASYRPTAAVAVDPVARVVRCADGSEHAYDVLSINTGPVADLSIPGVREHAMAVRPLETFVEAWAIADRTLRVAGHGRVVVIGGGAGGVELAMAIHHAFADLTRVSVALVSAADTLPGRTGPSLRRLLRDAGIDFVHGHPVASIAAGSMTLETGTVIDADAVLVATGAAAAGWIASSGLAIDERGFLITDTSLRVRDQANVFAAGDCATVQGHPRPKSGVHSLRAGPLLSANLRRALTGRALGARVPQRRSLHLVSAGRRYAVGSWGPLAFEGDWVWRWKDRIDRAFVARYSESDR